MAEANAEVPRSLSTVVQTRARTFDLSSVMSGREGETRVKGVRREYR